MGGSFFATYNEPVRHNDKTIIIAGLQKFRRTIIIIID